MRKSFASAALIVFAASTAAFADNNLPFEQTQFDRGLPPTHDASRSAYQKGTSQGSAAGASAQPGSHHNVQSPAVQSPAQRRDDDPARREPQPKYPLQPFPDPYAPV